MKCPVCQKHELVAQSLEDSFGNEPDLFCPEIICLPSGKVLNHYREQTTMKRVRIIIFPYRIITEVYDDSSKNYSQIGIHFQYKTGKRGYYFKTLLKTPALHSDLEEKLRDRIKLLLVLQ